MMDNNDGNISYGENIVDDMAADYDYQVNTHELSELFDEKSVDNLNDWD